MNLISNILFIMVNPDFDTTTKSTESQVSPQEAEKTQTPIPSSIAPEPLKESSAPISGLKPIVTDIPMMGKVKGVAEETGLLPERIFIDPYEASVRLALSKGAEEGIQMISEIMEELYEKTDLYPVQECHSKLSRFKEEEMTLFMTLLQKMYQYNLELPFFDKILKILELLDYGIKLKDFENKLIPQYFEKAILEYPSMLKLVGKLIDSEEPKKTFFEGCLKQMASDKTLLALVSLQVELLNDYNSNPKILHYLFASPHPNRNLAVYVLAEGDRIDKNTILKALEGLVKRKESDTELNRFLKDIEKSLTEKNVVGEYQKAMKPLNSKEKIRSTLIDPNLTRAQKFEFACQAAHFIPDLVHQYIKLFPFTDSERLEIAKISIASSNSLIDEIDVFPFEAYKLTLDQEKQLVIAILKKVIATDKQVKFLLDRFNATQKSDIIMEVVKEVDSMPLIQYFLSSSEKPQLKKILFQVATHNPKILKNFYSSPEGKKITSQELFEVGKRIARHGDITILEEFLGKFRSLTLEIVELYRIVLIHARDGVKINIFKTPDRTTYTESIRKLSEFFSDEYTKDYRDLKDSEMISERLLSLLAVYADRSILNELLPYAVEMMSTKFWSDDPTTKNYSKEISQNYPHLSFIIQPKVMLDQLDKLSVASPLKPLYELVKKAKIQEEKEEMLQWLGRVELRFKYENVPPSIQMKMLPILTDLATFYTREREDITDFIFSNRVWEKPDLNLLVKSPYERVLNLILLNIFDRSTELLNLKLLTHDSMKNSQTYTPILKGLLAIAKNGFFTPAKKKELVNAFIRGEPTNENIKGIARDLQLLTLLIDLGYEDKIITMESASKISEFIETILKVDIGLQGTPKELQEKYLATFGSSQAREPGIILIYAGQLKKLNDPIERENCLKALKEFMSSVFNGNEAYKDLRYKNNPHLNFAFRKRPEMKEEWMKGAKYDLETYLSKVTPQKKKEGVAEDSAFTFLKTQSGLGHLEDKSDIYKILNDFLKKENNEKHRKSAIEELKTKLRTTTEENKPKIHLQIAILTLLDTSKELKRSKIYDGKIKPLMEIIFAANSQFKNDLKELPDKMKPRVKPASLKGFTIEDTDNSYDFILSGKEVLGSCQNPTGDPEKNKCLLGYAVDGKIRMIAVKDANGKIVARRIMRLLHDPKFKTPVLYQELLYSDNRVTPEMKQAIDQLFIERAKALGIPLVRDSEDKDRKTLRIYPNPIISYGNPAPFEYVDTKQEKDEEMRPMGVVAKGEYTLPKASLSVIYVPPTINWKALIAASKK